MNKINSSTVMVFNATFSIISAILWQLIHPYTEKNLNIQQIYLKLVKLYQQINI